MGDAGLVILEKVEKDKKRIIPHAENIVLNHLRRRQEHILYGSTGGEVDLLVKEGLRIALTTQARKADPSETNPGSNPAASNILKNFLRVIIRSS